MEQLPSNTTTRSIRSSHYIDDENEKRKEKTDREWLEYVLNLDIITDAEYEQSIIRQRQSQSDTYTEEIYTFDEFQIAQAILVEIWDEEEVDQEAEKLELHYKLSGENPDLRLNQLLSESGLDYSQISIQDQTSISEEKRKLIDEIKTISNFWSSQTESYRQKFITSLPEFAEILGLQLSVEFLLPNIRQLIENKSNSINQKTQYRDILFDKTSSIVQFLQNSEISAGYTSLKDHLLPLYFDYFKDIQPEQDHCKILLQFKTIVGLLVHNDKVDLVLPTLLDMLKDDLDEEKRVLGLQILDLLAQDFGPDICGNYLMYEIVSLQDDPVYRVRKETCKYLVNISKTVETEVFLGVLLPVFKRLCSDHIWGVRKQAVEILPQISEIAPDDVKCGALLEIFKKFSKDQSKWVKQATTQYLGAFIVSFKGLEQSDVLLQFYTQLANELLDKKNVGTQAQQDEDDLFHCAFNFPAILFTLGKQSWSKLIPVYIKMTEDKRVRVRTTLSYSLHQVAKIIEFGSDLIPVFHKFVKDVNEVREGVLISLPEFISSLSEKELFVHQIQNLFFERQTSWRQRVIQAQNLGKLSELIQPSSFDDFFSFLLELCADEVAEVRLQSCSHIWRVLKSYENNQEIFAKGLEQILSFQESKKYTKRQDFIVMCEYTMLNHKEIFESHLVDRFCQLQVDPVVNVRIQLSMTLKHVYPVFKDNAKILSVIKRLKFDSSRDIQTPLKNIIIVEAQKATNEKMTLVDSLLDQIIDSIIE